MEPSSKRAKYDQVWKEEYGRSFSVNGISKSDKSLHSAFCSFCKCHFTIRSGGSYDIIKHCATQKHMLAERAASSKSNISQFFKGKVEDHSTIQSQVRFTKFLVGEELALGNFR